MQKKQTENPGHSFDELSLGAKIREKRKAIKISMVTLAKHTGFSQSYLSQVERGLINPSIGSLKRIAQALDVPVAHFFSNENNHTDQSQAPNALVVRANKRKGLIQPQSKVVYELLSPNLQCDIELLYIKAQPGGSSGTECFVHEGQEGGVVISGVMEYYVDDQIYVLNKGDSIYFNSNFPHRWKNTSEDEELIVIWATTPPSF